MVLGLAGAAAADELPPPIGPETPRVTPDLEDGLYTQA
jgi:hypothetical protein